MIYHRAMEGTEEADHKLSRNVIGAAIEVHSAQLPRIYESVSFA